MASDVTDLNALVRTHNIKFAEAREEIAKVIVEQQNLVNALLIAILADCHILLEGVPGLAKTLAVKTLATVLHCDFQRIQFTPDLLPADLIGTSIYNPKDGTFTVQKGPVFTNIVLADEINRAPAKVQSALLEVMEERQVTIGHQTFRTGDPFLVLATQNPIEQEGTYPLPEAQTDRFMLKVKIDYPNRDEEKQIIARMACSSHRPKAKPVLSIEDIHKAQRVVEEIYVDDKVTEYILDVVFATRDPGAYGVDIQGLLDYGASPRASLALTLAAKAQAFLAGRGFVTPHDVKMVAHDVLRHRLRRSYEAEAEDVTTDAIIDAITKTLRVP
ncbi:MAG: MoxR family ATPase [Chlamydiia bacterium]|nr:MoxR family ATPase [Chlamydiia bacterium]